MSLGRIALRMAVVEALKGKTLVGDNVLDSEIGVLATDAGGNVTSEQSQPFIAVYTDNGEVSGDSVRSLLDGGWCDLVIETGVAATMVERTVDGDKEIVSGLPATDVGFEVTLDLVNRQIVDALLDPMSAWSCLFQNLCLRVRKVVRQRVGHHQSGTRLAAQEMRISLDLVDDPERGIVLDPDGAFGLWLELLPQSASDDASALRKLQHRLRSYLLELQAGNAENWELARQRLGASALELLALGLGPLAQDVDRATPPFVRGDIDIDGTGLTEVYDDP